MKYVINFLQKYENKEITNKIKIFLSGIKIRVKKQYLGFKSKCILRRCSEKGTHFLKLKTVKFQGTDLREFVSFIFAHKSLRFAKKNVAFCTDGRYIHAESKRDA